MDENNWAFKIAESLIAQHKPSVIVCASGISPSGPIHIGNLREVITTDLVHKALVKRNANAEFILSWDDFDRLRKVPADLPETLSKYIGKPYSEIPDPYGEFNSYAQRFMHPFEETLKQLNINPRFISQTKMYKSGAYDAQINFMLTKRHEIALLLSKHMTQGMNEIQIRNYFPLNVYSRFTGKDSTEITYFNGDSKITYKCKETSKTDTIDFTKDRIVKLPWKIDWPMRWMYESVFFEPGGPDHATTGSSFDVSSQIAEKVLHIQPPQLQPYQFVRLKGQKKKMSSSTGNLITPQELLRVYSPELIRFIYARAPPNAVLDIALDKDVIRTYAEFDSNINTFSEDFFSLIFNKAKCEKAKAIPFRKIFGLGEATNYNSDTIREILSIEEPNINYHSIEERLQKCNYWSKNFFPEGRSNLNTITNISYYRKLPENRKENIKILSEYLKQNKVLNQNELETLIYNIPKKNNENETKIAQKQFFTDIYNLLFSKETGPRLSTYLTSSDRNSILYLINIEKE